MPEISSDLNMVRVTNEAFLKKADACPQIKGNNGISNRHCGNPGYRCGLSDCSPDRQCRQSEKTCIEKRR